MAAHDDKAAEKLKRLQDRLQSIKETRITNFVSKMMKDPEGREFAWWLLQIGRFGDQPYRRDPYDTAFAAGEMNVGQRILARLTEVEPGGFVLMQQEQTLEYRQHVTLRAEPAGDDAPGGDDTDANAAD